MPDLEMVKKSLENCISSKGDCTPDECPYYDRPDNDVRLCWERLMADAIILLKEHTEWIPVSERLPNDNEDILAYCVQGEESFIVPANYYNGEFYNCIFNVVMRCGVTHWMPLPKPPKKEGEQE